ncbi:MAG TPA: TraX family protein, partial [Bacteroidales bacterium]|nr:TraX family protein [Bacteroidales bacterium]
MKLIAIFSMVIDHIGLYIADGQMQLICRLIGRVGLLVWPYTIAFGVMHSRDGMRYFHRILYVAITSQPVFMLLGHYELNPVFSLLLGAIIIYCLEERKYWHLFGCIPLLFIVPYFFVVLTLVFYLFKDDIKLQIIGCLTVCMFACGQEFYVLYMQCVGIAVGFLLIHYGPGTNYKINRNLWYNFYNLHLCVIFGITILMGFCNG